VGGAMHLSELLSLPVVDHDHERVGSVIDVRLTVSGDPAHDPGAPHLAGLLVSPRTTSSYLGYERSDSRRPRPLAALLAWRHRGTFLAAWPDIARLGPEEVVLRPGYQRHPARLTTSATSGAARPR